MEEFQIMRDQINIEAIKENMDKLKEDAQLNQRYITEIYHPLENKDSAAIVKKAEAMLQYIENHAKKGKVNLHCKKNPKRIWVKTKVDSLRVFRLVYGLSVIKVLHQRNKTQKMRAFFYEGRRLKLFPKKGEKQAANAFYDVAVTLQIHINCLNIESEPQGLVRCNGKLKSFLGKTMNSIDDDVSIPTRGDYEIEFVRDPKFLVIVEHSDPFHKFVEAGIHTKLDCILVASGGSPDIATRKFVRYMKDKYNFPVLGVFDADIYGSEIMRTFCFGAMRTRYFNPYSSINHIYWIGLRPSDWNRIDEVLHMHQMEIPSKSDVKKTEKFLNEEFLLDNIDWKNEVELLKNGKASLSCLNEFNLEYVGEVWLLKKLQNNDWIHISGATL